MTDYAKKLKAYAELTVKIGLNIQPGQTLIVHALVESKDFFVLSLKKLMILGVLLINAGSPVAK
ncbi:aminopeptidase [Paenibacillus sp. NPDC093718]|uniref:aminopeptidase n=1 Tax=Paenibacillus sp. NPDC093718 TaxID=3390601 RepID=UPI003CFF07BA